ncbi:MAG: hypothetical protein H7336_07390 [Bacteriovorax sp.]|nr:hypothetical protein [Bacteriovorax sp.]
MKNFLFLTVLVLTGKIFYPEQALAKAKEWQELISGLHSEDARVSEPAWKELRAIDHLEDKLKNALTTNSRAEALYIISKIESQTLAEHILNEQIQNPSDSQAIFVLNQFLSSGLKSKILNAYSKWIEDKNRASDFRLLVLAGLTKEKYQVPKKVLVNLLNEKSYQLRIEAIRLAGIYSTSGQVLKEDYYTILSQAKHLKPYQARLEAYSWIMKLSPQLQKTMDITSDLCKKETNTEVRAACLKALKVK